MSRAEASRPADSTSKPEPGAAQGQAAYEDPPALKTISAPCKDDPAVLCTKLPDQEYRQASASGSMLGASAEGSVLAERDRWGPSGAISCMQSELCRQLRCACCTALC